jgi:FixJ family two-component response regulator
MRPSAKTMAKNQGTVYVIDDDAPVRTALVRLLRSANFLPQTYASVEEFLKNPQQKRDACILLDIRMPGSGDFDIRQNLTSLGVDIPAIVVSASDDKLVREHARRLGAVAFFRKPVDDQALLDAIHWALSCARRKMRIGGTGRGEGARQR